MINILYKLGIKPDFLIGHSIGELACAYADETLTLEQTVLIAYWRGISLITTELPKGAMAAVGECLYKLKISNDRLQARKINSKRKIADVLREKEIYIKAKINVHIFNTLFLCQACLQWKSLNCFQPTSVSHVIIAQIVSQFLDLQNQWNVLLRN